MGAIPSIMEISKSYTGIFIVGGVLGAINVTLGNLVVAQGVAKISLKAMLFRFYIKYGFGSDIHIWT